MRSVDLIFLILLFTVGYTYVGYPLVLWIISRYKTNKDPINQTSLPSVTLFVTAYNEADYVLDKVENSLGLNYPKDKLQLLWLTDGSTDNTNKLLETYPEISVMHQPERKGKIDAMNRGMLRVSTDVVVFSDANAMLDKDAILLMAKAFESEHVGCVAGEKKVYVNDKESASAAGEGIYWNYEGWVKKMESQVGTCIGAAGELFAVRTKLYIPLADNTLLDDFVISMQIAMRGYQVTYQSGAVAREHASLNIKEEMKRKVRIASGGFQAMYILKSLLNIFKYGFLTFQYVSHKVFRWLFTPLALVLMLVLNIYVVAEASNNCLPFYNLTLLLQAVFYSLGLLGMMLHKKQTHRKWLFLPFYFIMANTAMFLGFGRFLVGRQKVTWEKSVRAR